MQPTGTIPFDELTLAPFTTPGIVAEAFGGMGGLFIVIGAVAVAALGGGGKVYTDCMYSWDTRGEEPADWMPFL